MLHTHQHEDRGKDFDHRAVASNNSSAVVVPIECSGPQISGSITNDPIVLTFDHKDKKKGAIANLVHEMAHRKFAWGKILAEIQKCDVRCFNCHMRRTAKQLNRYKWLALEPS